jgi:hypothetical protein
MPLQVRSSAEREPENITDMLSVVVAANEGQGSSR